MYLQMGFLEGTTRMWIWVSLRASHVCGYGFPGGHHTYVDLGSVAFRVISGEDAESWFPSEMHVLVGHPI